MSEPRLIDEIKKVQIVHLHLDNVLLGDALFRYFQILGRSGRKINAKEEEEAFQNQWVQEVLMAGLAAPVPKGKKVIAEVVGYDEFDPLMAQIYNDADRENQLFLKVTYGACRAVRPLPVAPELIADGSMHAELNRIRLAGIHIDGFGNRQADAGDSLIRLMQLIAISGRVQNPKTNREEHGKHRWIEGYWNSLWNQPVPEGKRVVSDSLGYDEFEPVGTKDEFALEEITSGTDVLIPLRLDGRRPPEIYLPSEDSQAASAT